jgi:hypothetical protein
MFVEAFFLVVMLIGFWAAAVVRDLWNQQRDRRRRRWLSRLLPRLVGQPVDEAIAQFGPPFEVLEGAGSRLYCWKSPPSQQFPGGTGLLIVDLIVDRQGMVTRSSWHER